MKPRSQTTCKYKCLSTQPEVARLNRGQRENLPEVAVRRCLPKEYLACTLQYNVLSDSTIYLVELSRGIIERSIPSYPPYLNQPSHFSCEFHQTQLSSWHRYEVRKLYIFPIFVLLIPPPRRIHSGISSEGTYGWMDGSELDFAHGTS